MLVTVGVGNARATAGAGVSAGMAVAYRLTPAKAGESAVVAEGSDANGHGFSIDSVNIANAYPAPTATSKMDDRTMMGTNLLKAGPLALDVCWSA